MPLDSLAPGLSIVRVEPEWPCPDNRRSQRSDRPDGTASNIAPNPLARWHPLPCRNRNSSPTRPLLRRRPSYWKQDMRGEVRTSLPKAGEGGWKTTTPPGAIPPNSGACLDGFGPSASLRTVCCGPCRLPVIKGLFRAHGPVVTPTQAESALRKQAAEPRHPGIGRETPTSTHSSRRPGVDKHGKKASSRREDFLPGAAQ
jgi:hypothetical protein